MGWRTYDYQCADCGACFEDTVMVDNDKPELTNVAVCQVASCQGVANKIPSAPCVLNHSYPDGKRRFDDLRTIQSFKREIAGSRNVKERKKLKRELHKVEVIK